VSAVRLATLDSSSPVVRGGSRVDHAALLEELLEQEAALGVARLSVFIVEPAGDFRRAILEACQEVPIPHGKIQVATVERLLGRGFVIADERAHDEAACHYHVHFPTPVGESAVRAWYDCFDPPEPNPARA